MAHIHRACQIEGVLLLTLLASLGGVLTVGPGRQFARVEDAMRAAAPGDTIEVYARPGGYPRVAARISKPRLQLIGMGTDPVVLNGSGFDYSGVGQIPRAIIQVDPGGMGTCLRNLRLAGAHNGSHNGAGIRINGARDVTVERCVIERNDMGAMSNGSGNPTADAANQAFVDCHIHDNGDAADPGFNHNLYLGGASVALRHCEIDHSLTGHNVKSRAHFTLVEDCYVHDSANREFDFVEAAETETPNSNAAIVNCVIAKAPDCTGNRGVIHFGRERGVRRGGLWLVHSTVLTPFASAVVALDGATVHAEIDDDIVVNTEQAAPTLVEAVAGARLVSVVGRTNWLSAGYSVTGTRIDARSRYAGPTRAESLGISPPTFGAAHLPDVGIPAPAYYLDGNGKEWEVTPAALLGARWRPLRIDGQGSRFEDRGSRIEARDS